MSLVEKVNNEIKEAMLSRDKVRLETLRSIKKEFLEAQTAKGAGGELSDDQALKIIAKLLKQREESATMYREAGRTELMEEEEAQAKVLQSFLPEPLSEEELKEIIQGIIQRLGVSDMKGMGQVMGVATKEIGTRADGKLIADLVKQLLS